MLVIKALCMMDKRNYTLPKDKNGKVRFQERPIAYEFYYQLRKLLESEIREGKIAFHGEFDKRFQYYYPKCARKMPDFLIHVPNRKDKNYAIIEIKLASRSFDDILADIMKLKCFKEKLDYVIPVLILFGTEKILRNRLNKILEREESKEIYILGYNLDNCSIILYLPSE